MFPVLEYNSPIQRALKFNGEKIEMFDNEFMQTRSQDLEKTYHDAGQFYWGKTDDYLSNKKIFSHHSLPVVLPRHLVQDIDTPEDWQRAELMYQAYVQGQSSE